MPQAIQKLLKDLIPLGIVTSITVLSGGFLINHIATADSGAATTTVSVVESCSLLGTVDSPHEAIIINGHYQDNIGQTTLRTFCNDAEDYQIYAVGYTGCDEANEETCTSGSNHGNNTLLTTNVIGANPIATGIFTSGDTSSWAMKLTALSGSHTATILDNYDDYHTIPATSTQVANFTATTEDPTDSSITTTYAAYISPTQTTGTYTGKVKYTLVHQAAELSKYIQDYTLDKCRADAGGTGLNDGIIGENVTVYDRRDGNEYTVKYINGYCWMTQNLRAFGTISAEHSNFTGADIIIEKNNSAGISNFEPRGHKSSDNAIGAYYNYVAATAGTITGDSNTAPATQDICPKNWHLPSGPAPDLNSDLYKIFDSTSTGWIPMNDYLKAFSPVAGGDLYHGAPRNTQYGYCWSATAINGKERYGLSYNSTNNTFMGGSDFYYSRWDGMSIRCVRTS